MIRSPLGIRSNLKHMDQNPPLRRVGIELHLRESLHTKHHWKKTSPAGNDQNLTVGCDATRGRQLSPERKETVHGNLSESLLPGDEAKATRQTNRQRFQDVGETDLNERN